MFTCVYGTVTCRLRFADLWPIDLDWVYFVCIGFCCVYDRFPLLLERVPAWVCCLVCCLVYNLPFCCLHFSLGLLVWYAVVCGDSCCYCMFVG